MITIKSVDGSCLKIEKEKLLNIDYFKKYFNDQYTDDKEIIKLDYNLVILKHFIDSIDDYRKPMMNKDMIMEYLYFLNYIGFDKYTLNLIELFNDYESDMEYIIQIIDLYPQYIKIIQNRLNEYIFDEKKLKKLEETHKISNCDLYFTTSDEKKNMGNVVSLYDYLDMIKTWFLKTIFKPCILFEYLKNTKTFFKNMFKSDSSFEYLKKIKIFLILEDITNLKNFNVDRIYGLTYTNKEIDTIPTEISSLTNLQSLNLYWNEIREISKEISNLTNLRCLDLSDNEIREIPKEISNLTNLQFLDLSENKISEIPKEISNLTNLQTLCLYNNKISIIPKEINNLTNLRYLDLSYNKISEIPKEISNLTNLQSLDLSFNKINEIPTELEHIKKIINL